MPENESPPPYDDGTLEYLKRALRYIGCKIKHQLYILSKLIDTCLFIKSVSCMRFPILVSLVSLQIGMHW